MDVATPTADCLILVHDLLLPVIMKSRSKNLLSHQEVRLFVHSWVVYVFFLLTTVDLEVNLPIVLHPLTFYHI